MLPLVIRAAEHQGVLHPDTASGEVEACVDKRPAEVQPFGVGVEYVGRAAFLEHVRHVHERGEQECVELFVLDAVVLNRQAAGAFERHTIGRVRHDQVRAGAVHELLYIFRFGGVAAHEPVSADRPHVSGLHKRSLLQRGGEVIAVIFNVGVFILEKVSQLTLVKPGKERVKILRPQ